MRAVALKRHRNQSELVYGWVVDAYWRAVGGKWLPPKPERAEYGSADPANVMWPQDAAEFETMSAAISGAGSSVRACVEHAIRWYKWRDGDPLVSSESPFDRKRIPAN